MKKLKLQNGMFLLALIVVASGCQDIVGEPRIPSSGGLPPVQPVAATAEAGVGAQVGPAKLAEDLIALRTVQPVFVPRPDPFRLRPFEAEWDIKQGNLRIVEQVSGPSFGAVFQVEPEVVTVQVTEPQPYRRLAGVIVGDSVLAIIDMGDGRPMQLIRPGMQIPNSPWRVVSIDAEKAVLRRTGNRLPKEVVVRLENPPSFGLPSATPVTAPAAPPGGQGGRRNNPRQNSGRQSGAAGQGE